MNKAQIKKISVKGFQSLLDIDLDLGDITVVKGASDSGKSALVRAFKMWGWNMSSPPIHHKEKECSVRCLIDGEEITVSKSRSGGNSYSTKEKTWTQVGVSVPEEVVEHTGIYDLSVATDDSGKKQTVRVQLRDQISPLFLVLDSDAVKAKVIGAISQTHRINSAAKMCQADISAHKSRIDVLEKMICEEEEQIPSLKIEVDKRQKILSEVTPLVEAVKSDFQLLSKLKSIRDRILDIDSILLKVSEELESLNFVDECDADLGFLNSEISRLNELLSIGSDIDRLGIEVKGLDQNISEHSDAIKGVESKLERFRKDVHICPVTEEPLIGGKCQSFGEEKGRERGR